MIFHGQSFLVPVEQLSYGDVVCVLPTNVILFCTPLPRYSVHQSGFVQLAQQRLQVSKPIYSIYKCRFVSRPHNTSSFKDYWGIAAKFELEALFQLVIPSSCCDEHLTQQLRVDLYCFIVDFDSWCTRVWQLGIEAVLQHFLLRHWRQYLLSYFYCGVHVYTAGSIDSCRNASHTAVVNWMSFEIHESSNSSHESVMSFPCLAVVKSLCCWLVFYCTSVSCCIALFTSAQTGCDINQTMLWASVMPRPLAKHCLHAPHDDLLNDKIRGKSCLEPIWSAYNVEPLIEVSGNLWGFMKLMYLLQV